MIDKVRRHPKIILAIFGLCCLLFFVETFVRSFFVGEERKEKEIFSGLNVVEVLGKKLKFGEYKNRVEELRQYEVYGIKKGSSLHVSLCNNGIIKGFIEDVVYAEMARNIGIRICHEEKNDIIYGDNLDDEIIQSFKNDKGKFSRKKYNDFLKEVSSNNRMKILWKGQEERICENNVKNKVKCLLKILTNVNSLEIERELNERNNKYDIEYVDVKKLGNVNDLDIGKEEMQQYFEKHKMEYSRSETFVIKYFIENFSFDEQTKRNNILELDKLREQFRKCINPEEFAKIKGDKIDEKSGRVYKEVVSEDDLPDAVRNEKDKYVGAVVVELAEKIGDFSRLYKIIDIDSRNKNDVKYTIVTLYKKPRLVDEARKKYINELEKKIKTLKDINDFEAFAKKKGFDLESIELTNELGELYGLKDIYELKRNVHRINLKTKGKACFLPLICDKDSVFIGYLCECKGKGTKNFNEVEFDVKIGVENKKKKTSSLEKLSADGLEKMSVDEIKKKKIKFVDGGKETDVSLNSSSDKHVGVLKRMFLLPEKVECKFINNVDYLTKIRIDKIKKKAFDVNSDEYIEFAENFLEKQQNNIEYIKIFEGFYKIKKYENAYYLI